MNIFILLTTVTLMPTVQTLRDRSTARATQDTLEMASHVPISTNVTHLDCPLSTNTWLTSAMMMLTVQTPKDLTTAHVWRDTLEREFHVETLMSALLEHTIVMPMLTVPTPKDHSTARVIRDILEMASHVLISMNVTWKVWLSNTIKTTHTTVTLTPIVPIRTDPFTARATMVTQEMESHV